MRIRSYLPALAVATAVAAMPSAPLAQAAAANVYQIDAAHSQVSFKVKHLGISTVTGSFGDFSGTVTYDPRNVAASQATAVIKAASINTNNERRDTHLRSADFFETEKFPEITFSTGRVRRTGQGLKVDGTLTMHGVTRPIVLDAAFVGTTRGPDGKERVAFEATTKVDRREFGLTWNRAVETGGVVVGNDVQIILDIAAVKR